MSTFWPEDTVTDPSESESVAMLMPAWISYFKLEDDDKKSFKNGFYSMAHELDRVKSFTLPELHEHLDVLLDIAAEASVTHGMLRLAKVES